MANEKQSKPTGQWRINSSSFTLLTCLFYYSFPNVLSPLTLCLSLFLYLSSYLSLSYYSLTHVLSSFLSFWLSSTIYLHSCLSYYSFPHVRSFFISFFISLPLFLVLPVSLITLFLSISFCLSVYLTSSSNQCLIQFMLPTHKHFQKLLSSC